MADSDVAQCNIFKPYKSFTLPFTRFKDGKKYGKDFIEQFEACLKLHKKNKIQLADGIYIFQCEDHNRLYYVGIGRPFDVCGGGYGQYTCF
jgi:hypothetical protein